MLLRRADDDRNFMVLPYEIGLHWAQIGFRLIHQKILISKKKWGSCSFNLALSDILQVFLKKKKKGVVSQPNSQDFGGSWTKWDSPVPRTQISGQRKGVRRLLSLSLFIINYSCISQSPFFFLLQFVVFPLSLSCLNTCWHFLSLQEFLFLPPLHYLIFC